MKRPEFATMLVSHPIVMVPLAFGGVLAIIGALLDHAAWPLVVIALPVLVGLAGASRQRAKYFEWEREWNAMIPRSGEPAARPTRKARPLLGTAMLIGLGLSFAANADQPIYALALGWLIVAGGLVGIVALIRRVLKAKGTPRATKAVPVSICVRGPLLSVPSMIGAYRSLPLHCQALFAAQERARR